MRNFTQILQTFWCGFGFETREKVRNFSNLPKPELSSKPTNWNQFQLQP